MNQTERCVDPREGGRAECRQTSLSLSLNDETMSCPSHSSSSLLSLSCHINTSPTAHSQRLTLTVSPWSAEERGREGGRMSQRRDFPFGQTVQRNQREHCLTYKCPPLHTAVTNSLWTPRVDKYSSRQAFTHSSASCTRSITVTTSVRTHQGSCNTSPVHKLRPW